MFREWNQLIVDKLCVRYVPYEGSYVNRPHSNGFVFGSNMYQSYPAEMDGRLLKEFGRYLYNSCKWNKAKNSLYGTGRHRQHVIFSPIIELPILNNHKLNRFWIYHPKMLASVSDILPGELWFFLYRLPFPRLVRMSGVNIVTGISFCVWSKHLYGINYISKMTVIDR